MLMTPFTMSMSMTMVLSSIMALSSSNWLMLWLALEINLMSFLPLMLTSSKFQETEAAIKYFMAQAIGSSLLLLSTMSMWMYNNIYMFSYMILLMALTIKIGLFPCHFWYTSVMNSISWMNAVILSTWQKLAPLMIMSSLMIFMNKYMTVLAVMNALTGGLMGINQSQLRVIMAYSSITHLGWMCALISMNLPNFVFMYFVMYSMLIIPMFIMFNKSNITITNQMNKSMNMNITWCLIMSIMFLSLGGLPPLLGFFPKLMTMMMIAKSSMIMVFMLIMGSLCNLYFYLNVMFSMIMNQSIYGNKNNKMNKLNLLALVSILTLWLPLIML